MRHLTIILDQLDLISTRLEALEARLEKLTAPRRWLTPAAAMQVLNIKSPKTLKKLRDAGELAFHQVSARKILYCARSLEEFLERRRSG